MFSLVLGFLVAAMKNFFLTAVIRVTVKNCQFSVTELE